MENSSYTEMEVWKKSRSLVKKVYDVTNQYPKEEMYGLTMQIRRAPVSIASNIAEGIGRNYFKDTIQFLYISRGSAYELETQMFLSLDLKYVDNERFSEIIDLITECKKLLNGTINYYDKKTTH
jgi:four helix bundle protein